jgi:hypothetical protein
MHYIYYYIIYIPYSRYSNGPRARRPWGRSSNPGRFRIFSSRQRPGRLWDPPSLLSNGSRGRFPRGKAAGVWSRPLTSMLPMSRKAELYLHSPMCLHGIALKQLSAGTTLPFLFYLLLYIPPRNRKSFQLCIVLHPKLGGRIFLRNIGSNCIPQVGDIMPLRSVFRIFCKFAHFYSPADKGSIFLRNVERSSSHAQNSCHSVDCYISICLFVCLPSFLL